MIRNASLLILFAGLSVILPVVIRWKRRTRADSLLELCLIGLWALWVGREYLDFDLRVWPSLSTYFGTINEISSSIQPHFVWSRLAQCGVCMLWNGSVNGGAPALADIYGATLNPVVIVTTLLFGAINGAKITLVVSFFIAGAAQWWLARVMSLGRIACLWSAALVVVAGHLVGRMESGSVTLVLSTAFCSTVRIASVRVSLSPGRCADRPDRQRAGRHADRHAAHSRVQAQPLKIDRVVPEAQRSGVENCSLSVLYFARPRSAK